MTALQRELKYVFPNSRARLLREWLDVRCEPDPKFAAGRISSIYFDTCAGELLDEKVNSDYLKTKVRLRWYGDWTTGAPAGGVFLEVKQRTGSTRKKFRRRLDWPAADLAAMALEDVRLLEVNRWIAEAGFRFSSPLRPVVCLEYRRRRYIEAATRTRICLDHDLRTVGIHTGSGHATDRTPLAEGVFEVKGAVERLPETLHPLIAMGCRKQSFSKFQKCMDRRNAPAHAEGSSTRRNES